MRVLCQRAGNWRLGRSWTDRPAGDWPRSIPAQRRPATQVGYESASQFNREFKCLFGLTSAAEVRRTKENFAVPPAHPGSGYVFSH